MNDPILAALEPGERVEWRGVPAQGFWLEGQDIFLIPFGAFWLAAVGAFLAFSGDNEAHVRLMLIMMMAMGTFIFFGRFPLDAYLRSGTVYALTNRRVLVARRFPGALVSLPLERIGQIELQLRSKDRGTLDFAGPQSFFARAQDWSIWLPSLRKGPCFVGIADARRVLALIERLRRAPGGDRGGDTAQA